LAPCEVGCGGEAVKAVVGPMVIVEVLEAIQQRVEASTVWGSS